MHLQSTFAHQALALVKGRAARTLAREGKARADATAIWRKRGTNIMRSPEQQARKNRPRGLRGLPLDTWHRAWTVPRGLGPEA